MNRSIYIIGILLAGLFLTSAHCELHAQYTFPDQGPVYADSIVPRIDIFIDPSSLAALYANPALDNEYPCTFIFKDLFTIDTVLNTGLRIRGNTSRYAWKKSFKVSFNTFVPGRKFHHLEKLNLNGEHNDPSIIRSKLCWDLFRDIEVPAPRANHVELYINGRYYGLYINVEHIDENFVKARFGNNNGNLYKCLYPAPLVYLGSNPDLYKVPMNGTSRAYALKINEEADDYSDLAHFIDVLNNSAPGDFPSAIEQVFDVNNFIKASVIDILTGNWDGYIYNQNNMYLYHNTETGLFEYIPYDLDNTFGIDWFGIDWGNRDINAWRPSGSRPLFDRIMQEPAYKERFAFYLHEALLKYFNITKMGPAIDMKELLITPSAERDSFRTLDYGYSVDDFLNSYTQSLSGHVKYGLKPYITTRSGSAAAQLIVVNVAPIITRVRNNMPSLMMPLIINAMVEDEDPAPVVGLHYSFNGGPEQVAYLYDDGSHQDFLANDLTYGVELPAFPEPGILSYYIQATDVHSRSSREPVTGWYQYSIGGSPASVSSVAAGNSSLLVYPNPSMDIVNIVVPGDIHDEWQLSICNVAGQLVYSDRIYAGSASTISWNGKDNTGNRLPAGLYMITMQNLSSGKNTGQLVRGKALLIR